VGGLLPSDHLAIHTASQHIKAKEKQRVTQWWVGYTICPVTVLQLVNITLSCKWCRFYTYTYVNFTNLHIFIIL